MKENNILTQEFQYYLDHQEDLLPKYNGKYVVIVGNQVVGAYDDRTDAYYSSLQQYTPGTFMIQLCTPGEEAYTVRYYNRVAPISIPAQV